MTDVHNGAHEGSEDGADARDGGLTPLTAADPARIGPYLLLGRLGAGGMGRVYLARSAAGRTVAVKVVHEEHVADRQFRARFRREIDAARRVSARYTAPVLDAAPDEPLPWVATGYVPGLSLDQVVRGHGALPGASVRALADGLLRALDGIHGAGIVHRDLKPSNVMLTADAPKVIDFGIARAVGTSVESLLTSTGMVIGSPGFMSPEQILGNAAGPKSDVFTLGCVLTYAATGTLPFGRDVSNQHAVMFHIVESTPDLDEVRDAGLRALIGRCLIKEAEQRPSVGELLAERGSGGGAGGGPGSDPRSGSGSGSGPASRRPAGASWLPPEVLGRLARQSARLLDAEAAPVREEAPDRQTVGLHPAAPAHVPAPAATVREPGQDPAGAPAVAAADEAATGKPEGKPGKPERERRRAWTVSVPVVMVLAVGGGTLAVLQPFGRSTPPPSAAAPATTTPASPSASGGSPGKGDKGSHAPKGKDGNDPGKGGGGDTKDGGKGEDGRDGRNGRDADAGAATPAGGGSGSDTSSGGGGGGTPGGTGSGTSGGGGAGGGSTVPSSFVGSWTFGESYNTGQPGSLTISRSGTVRMSDFPYNSCPYQAEVTSATSRRINVGAAKLVGPNPGYCSAQLDPSYFTVNGSGIQHNVGAASGNGYYYKRA